MDNLNWMEKEKVRQIIDQMKFVMLVTKDENGCMHSRPMGTIETEQDLKSLWFFTEDNSAKARDIEKDPHVNLSYSNPEENTYLSICGKAKIVKDKEKIAQLWTPLLKDWFPEGINDPHICLIEVNPTEAQYWIYPDSTIYQAIQFVKKLTFGEDTELGENRKIDLVTT